MPQHFLFTPPLFTLFQALDCDELNSDVETETYLRADYGISCDWSVDSNRPAWLAYTIGMLLLWPVGVPCYVANLFWRNKQGVHIMMRAYHRNLPRSFRTRAHLLERACCLLAASYACCCDPRQFIHALST